MTLTREEENKLLECVIIIKRKKKPSVRKT
jgi:hypothetical protein